MNHRLAWGILGTGAIARTFAKALAGSERGRLVAVGSRSKETAEAFGAQFGIARRHASYEELLADPAVQAVYIATPHPMHAEWTIKAAEAGKHILCEKPLALNYPEAMAVVEAARRHDVFLMEAFMYRCHPQTAKLVELIRSKIIGEVCVIQATFSFAAGPNAESRLLKNALGGGGILDVGCYCISIARLVAGAAQGKDFAEPVELTGCGKLHEVTGVDEWAIASLKFPGGIVAEVSTGVRVAQENVVRIFGSEGSIFIPDPFAPAREGGTTRIAVRKRGQPEPEEIEVRSARPLYAFEADTVAAHIAERQAPSPAMTWEDSLGNMKSLDRWRQAVGVVYDAEKPGANRLPVHRRPLAVRKDHRMKFGRIPGIEMPVSRLVMGVDNQRTLPMAQVMFDDFFESGGNCFDTAYIYGGGECEKMLGHWVKDRNIRRQVLILGKGACTPFCTPKDLTAQLMESLERLQTDYLDIYMMHRDNPEVPVGEFVDVLNEHRKAGRMRAFGGSNWTLERVGAANEYARSKGLAGFAAVSNNFSLARMVEAPWRGCLAASDARSREWFGRTQMTLMPWSSQARGFFAGAASPENRSDREMVRCWYSEDNFQRLARAKELAAKRGVQPINIALAYVLCQPFPTFPLIGPWTLHETSVALQGLEVQLTPEELRYLNLED
jgi:predicted dehydrogenase/aryl-alcohol dehydrogenase-like predicted oxidoreductase